MAVDQFLKTRILNNTVEQLLWFVGIILLAWLLKSLGSRLISRALYRVFRQGNEDDHRVARENFKSFVFKPLQSFLMVTSIFVAYKFLRIPRKIRVFEDEYFLLRYTLTTLLEVILILSFTLLLIKMVNYVAFRWSKRAEKGELKFDAQLIPFFKDGLKVILFIFGLLFVIGFVFNKDITAIIGGLGIGGLAIALAAQETLSNLLGSVTIFLDKPFRAGDLIDIGGISGTVENVGLRSTRLRTVDKSFVTVPNKDLVGKILNNITQSTHRRANFTLRLSYGTQPEQLKQIIEEIRGLLDQHPLVAEDYVVRFFEFGESSLNILVAYLVTTNDYDIYVNAREEINYLIYDVVEKNGSSFAYPTRRVVVEGNNGPIHPSDLGAAID